MPDIDDRDDRDDSEDALDSAAGSGSSWPGWQNVDVALQKFAEAINNAREILNHLKLAMPVRDWLKDVALEKIEEYQERLVECSDDIDAALQLTKDLEDEASDIEDLLDDLDDVIGKSILNIDASDNVQEDLEDYINEKLGQVTETGWNVYNVFLGAA